MIRFGYVTSTLIVGVLFQIVLTRYLSMYDAAPQVLLLLTVTHGFVFGPIMGEALGFSWGLMSDATGVRLFGMNALLLTVIGYLAGRLRRRVASERLTAQLVVAVVATIYYAVGASNLHSLFEEAGSRFSFLRFFLEAIYNMLIITVLFLFTERWLRLWKIEPEHM